MQNQYDVILSTPIGKRKGSLCLSLEGAEADGQLSLFGKSSPVAGTVDLDGKAKLTGSFTTLRNTYFYEADGTVTDVCVDLQLRSSLQPGKRPASNRTATFRLNGKNAEKAEERT